MGANTLTRLLERHGLHAEPDGGLLRIRPAERLTPALRQIIAAAKPLLMSEPANDSSSELGEILDWLERIGEDSPEVIAEAVALAKADDDAMRYFLLMARGEFCESIKRPAEFCHALKGDGESPQSLKKPAGFLESLKEADELEDDRRTCRECANLTTNLSGESRCLAAWRGQIKDASRHYHPNVEIKRRCSAFAARRNGGAA